MANENPLLHNLVPHTAHRNRFQPVEGGTITISLPGEKLVAVVKGVVSPDRLVAQLDRVPMMSGKSHFYQRGDMVGCRRSVDTIGIECWVVIPERELDAAVAAQQLEDRMRQQEEAAQPKEEPAQPETQESVSSPPTDNWSA